MVNQISTESQRYLLEVKSIKKEPEEQKRYVIN